MSVGSWVEWSGLPSMLGGTVNTYKHNLGIDTAQSHLRLAPQGSELVAGIVYDTTYTIQDGGICMAWVVKPLKTVLPFTGIYAHTVNGISRGQVVVVHNPLDDSFIMAKSKDDGLVELAAKFAALTNS